VIRACRSCQAAVEWVVTINGKPMPLDLGLQLDGNLVVGSDGIARATEDRPARRSHFATCPHAHQHRRRSQ
jgi:hypothetical protein